MWRKWNLFEEIEDLHREIDRVFAGIGFRPDDFWPLRSTFLPGRSARTYPMLNVYEDPEALFVEALAPGLDTDSLEVSVQGRTLTISGKKKPLEGVEPEAFHRTERASARFVRTIELPFDVDQSKAEARYENGILMLTLPKTEESKPRLIEVNVSG